ncbi:MULTISPECIES: hypothetical protein [unclassified Streptomyces]|uniref:hypothetical protein n=1 Tax=unclassified Streptomyces TaxID=2593676 RepID=UPI002E2E119D|nr:hypothetical protein [Streptomyces sp. NBC_01439]
MGPRTAADDGRREHGAPVLRPWRARFATAPRGACGERGFAVLLQRTRRISPTCSQAGLRFRCPAVRLPRLAVGGGR